MPTISVFLQLIVQYAHRRDCSIFSLVFGIMHDDAILNSFEAHNKPHLFATGGITLYLNVKSLAAIESES